MNIGRFPFLRFFFHTKSLKQRILQNPVNDVLLLHGMPAALEDVSTSSPYVLINKSKLLLSGSKSIKQISSEADFAEDVKFYDLDFNLYLPSYPMGALLTSKDPFYIEINLSKYFVVTQTQICPEPKSEEYKKTEGAPELEPIVHEILEELSNKQNIGGSALQSLIIQSIMRKSEVVKAEKTRLKQMLKVVNKKLQAFNAQIQAVEQKIKRSQSKKVKWFCSFLIGQFGLLHYLIYFHLSWDILEPVTVILGNIDIFCAYFFFLKNSKQFSLQAFQNHKVGQTLKKKSVREGIDMQKYEQLKDIRDWLTLRLDLMSKNELVVRQQCQTRWDVIDTS